MLWHAEIGKITEGKTLAELSPPHRFMHMLKNIHITHPNALWGNAILHDTVRVSSGQGKVREIPDLAKDREKSGNFVEGQGKKWIVGKVREKSGNLHLVQSK